jgi:hypothetical protein
VTSDPHVVEELGSDREVTETGCSLDQCKYIEVRVHTGESPEKKGLEVTRGIQDGRFGALSLENP